eukprot:1097644-Pelagomonas_calceolata.AAC.1
MPVAHACQTVSVPLYNRKANGRGQATHSSAQLQLYIVFVPHCILSCTQLPQHAWFVFCLLSLGECGPAMVWTLAPECHSTDRVLVNRQEYAERRPFIHKHLCKLLPSLAAMMTRVTRGWSDTTESQKGKGHRFTDLKERPSARLFG